jgi:proteasome assembly chaperone (PAC2) family protein
MKKSKILFSVILGLGLLSFWAVSDTKAEEAQKTMAADKAGQVIVPIGAKRDREMNKGKIEEREKKLKAMHEKMQEKIRKMKNKKQNQPTN